MPKVGSLMTTKTNPDMRIIKLDIKEGQELVLKRGDVLYIDKPETYFNGLVTNGILDASKAEEILGNTPDFVKGIVGVDKGALRG